GALLGSVRDILAGVFGYVGSLVGGFHGVLHQVLRADGRPDREGGCNHSDQHCLHCFLSLARWNRSKRVWGQVSGGTRQEQANHLSWASSIRVRPDRGGGEN